MSERGGLSSDALPDYTPNRTTRIEFSPPIAWPPRAAPSSGPSQRETDSIPQPAPVMWRPATAKRRAILLLLGDGVCGPLWEWVVGWAVGE